MEGMHGECELKLRELSLFCLDLVRYKLMLDCWNINPSRRPGFKAIKEELETRLLQSSNYLYLEQEESDSSVKDPSPLVASDTGSGYWTGEHLRTEDDDYLAPKK